MPHPIEREIASQLEASKDVRSVGRVLRQSWLRGQLSESDKLAAADFHLQAGLIRPFFKLLGKCLDQGQSLPWGILAETLAELRVELSAQEAEDFLTVASEENKLSEFLLPSACVRLHPRFKKLASYEESKRTQAVLDNHKSLWDQVALLKTSRMLEQEKEMLGRIQAFFPGDPDLEKAEQDWKERWAREILNQSSGRSVQELSREQMEMSEELTLEEKKMAAVICQDMINQAWKTPKASIDLAIGLHFMEFTAAALQALEASQQEKKFGEAWMSRDWLFLHLLLQARKYVEVLDAVQQMENLFESDPDAVFALAYYRAQAYWGLREKELAVDLMQSIVSARPNYRSAHLLLLEWTGGQGA